jgi:hypothetical protein
MSKDAEEARRQREEEAQQERERRERERQERERQQAIEKQRRIQEGGGGLAGDPDEEY